MRAFDILSTTPFRRLAAKQQVFGLIGDDHSRTRYSHSVETAEIAKRLLAETPADRRPGGDAERVVEAAALIHDIGMPPFGHKGEAHVRAWVAAERPRLSEFGQRPYAEYAAFDSNAQGLRLIRYHPEFAQLRAPEAAPVVAAAMKYPWTRAGSNAPKCGILDSELSFYRRVAAGAGVAESRDGVFERHPLSWITEIADDVAYLSADIEDAGRLNVIDWEEFEAIFEPLAPPPAGAAFESRGHALWSYRRRLVDRLVGLFAQKAARAPAGAALAIAAEDFFESPLVQTLKTESARAIYARRDAMDQSSTPVMERLLRDLFAEFSEEAARRGPIKRTVARFRAKRAALVERSSPLQLTVDLLSEFTDNFAVALVDDAPARSGALTS